MTAIILAAGGSSRMGRAKQLLPWNGRSLLSHAVTTASAAGLGPVVVVLGRDADACAAELREDSATCRLVVNPRWEHGLGGSIRCGVRSALESSAVVEGIVLMLADQPHVTPDTLRRLLTAREQSGRPVAVAEYAETVGPPVVVAGPYLRRLADWPEHRGAKSLWAEHSHDVVRVPVPEAAVDIDTPADYAALTEAASEARE